MDGNTPGGEWDKSKLPSRHVSVGNTSAPHRAFYYAMGMTEEEIKQPFVGVVTTSMESAAAAQRSRMTISLAAGDTPTCAGRKV